MTSPTLTIEAVGLTKTYASKGGDVHALAGLDLVAPAGKVTAVLGPNGAGKTTFVKAVATLLRPDSGELHVAGIDALRSPQLVRRVIGLGRPERGGRARPDRPGEPDHDRPAVRPRP